MVAQLRERLNQFVSTTWLSLGAYRDDDIELFIARMIPAVVSGQRTIAQLTNAYLSQIASVALGGRIVEALDLSMVTGNVLRGVDMKVEYRRPAVALYSALKDGKPFRVAVNEGLSRATDLVSTDLQLAKTHTVAQSKRIIGFRRTLSGSENCDLCPLAAAHFYSRGDLMPIHPHCDCGIMPVFSKFDPPLPEPVTSDRAIAVREHGEIGPVLTWADQKFTGPDDIH